MQLEAERDAADENGDDAAAQDDGSECPEAGQETAAALGGEGQAGPVPRAHWHANVHPWDGCFPVMGGEVLVQFLQTRSAGHQKRVLAFLERIRVVFRIHFYPSRVLSMSDVSSWSGWSLKLT
jgi:hypothetical protein